jgi:hypothetical protein
MMSVAAALAAPAVAQVYAQHGAGMLTAGDFNADGIDDVLALPANDPAQVWLGGRSYPHLQAGPRSQLYPIPLDLPVLSGGHLYVPHPSQLPGCAEISVYRAQTDGSLHHVNTWTLWPYHRSAMVTSVKLAPLDQDIDQDTRNDCCVVWGEEPLLEGGGFHVAYVSPFRFAGETRIPRLSGQPENSTVAAVHLGFHPLNQRSEFLVTLSATMHDTYGGFGIQPIGPGPSLRQGLWIQGAPPLQYQGNLPTVPVSVYSRFSPAPVLGSLAVKLHTGHTAHFYPWPIAPFVQPQGEIHRTTTLGVTLGQCTYDYDGDGTSEMVFLEPFGSYEPDFLALADPGPSRPYIQIFELSPTQPFPRYHPFHGACGDFNGDGRKDLLLLGSSRGVSGSQFVLLLNSPNATPRQPPLRRAY